MPVMQSQSASGMPESETPAETAVGKDDVRLPASPKICKYNGNCYHYDYCLCRTEVQHDEEWWVKWWETDLST